MTTSEKQPRRLSRLVRQLAMVCVPLFLVGMVGCSVSRSYSRAMGPVGSAMSVVDPNSAFLKTPVVPPPGVIYTNYKAPVDYDFSEHGMGTNAADLKSGMSEVKRINIPYVNLSFAWGGDASLKTAAADGGINTINFVDYETFGILTVYTRTRFHVYGE